MAMQTAQDIPMLIVSQNSSSERRISPSWSISHFKTRLEPITGISSGAQKLELRLGGSQRQPIAIEAADEDSTQLANWPLRAYAEIHVGPCVTVVLCVGVVFISVVLWYVSVIL